MQSVNIITQYILPQNKNLSPQSIQYFQTLITSAQSSMSQKEFIFHIDQWKLVAKKFNTNSKATFLKHQTCRDFIIEMIKQQSMKIFNYSYLNRAKIDSEYIKYLKQLKPHFFIQVIMIVSKLKIIHKHYYHSIKIKLLQNHISIKILNILELCNQKKRSINNNKAKFLCIVQDTFDRVEITKQLGKMLREAWKKQKEKGKKRDEEEEEYQLKEQYQRKEYVKINQNLLEGSDFSINLNSVQLEHSDQDFQLFSAEIQLLSA